MPKNKDFKVEKGPFRSRRGEEPITRVRDLLEASSVRVLQAPSSMSFDAMWDFVHAAWADEPATPRPIDMSVSELLDDLLNSGRLWHAQEILSFMISFDGITRLLTHQLVRQRVGVVFSQQCSADSDWRHHDLLVPRSIGPYFRQYVEQAIQAKMLYAKMVDHDIGIREARHVLPQNLETFLLMYAPASVVTMVYNKRMCTMISPWEMVVLMRKMRDSILEVAPYMERVLSPRPCIGGRCWWTKASPQVRTNLYIPDVDHDVSDWNPASFEHDRTAKQVAGNNEPPILTRYFQGLTEIGEEEWIELNSKYQM
jgi:thymidylate synthase (FAD)